MALEDVVDVSITRRTSATERAGFGTLLHLVMHRAWSDRLRTYTDEDELLEDEFAANDPAYRGALRYFAQEPKPERIVIGRMATGDVVTVVIDVQAGATRYTVFIDGIGFEYTSTLGDFAEIEAALVSVINTGYGITAVDEPDDVITIAGNHVAAFPVGKQFRITGSTGNDGTYTVAAARLVAGSTEITTEEDLPNATADGFVKSLTPVTAAPSPYTEGFITIEPDVAATFFTCKVSSNLHLEFELEGSITENYAAIKAVDAKTWYGVTLARQYGGTNKDQQRELADAVEADRKLFGCASPDKDIINVAVSSDDPDTGTIARQLQALGYARTWVMYSGDATGDFDEVGSDTFPDCAWFGARFPTDPGRETWKFEALAGVLGDDLTATQRANALAKNANVYVPVTEDRSMTEEGTVAEGEFIDVIRFVDFLHSDITLDVFDGLINPPPPMDKVPYTDAGVGVVDNILRGTLQRSTTEGNDVRGLSSFTTTVPTVADASTADRAARLLRNVRFAGVLSGAIHAVRIEGTVSV